MCTTQRRLVINESVTWANLDDEAVLLNVETGIYYGLDAIGTRIWGLLTQCATEVAIFNQLRTEYDVEADRLRADLSALLEELTAKGLTRASNDEV